MQRGADVLQLMYLYFVLHAEQQQHEQRGEYGARPGGSEDRGVAGNHGIESNPKPECGEIAGYIAPETKVGASTCSASSLPDGSLTVMRQSVRGSPGSVSVAECSSDALSQITTSPTRYA